MTIKGRQRGFVAAAVIALGALAATLLPMLASTKSDAPREIRLVARDMRFYLDGSTEPNPTISVRAGERVTIVLRNEDPGMRHDFAIKALSVGTRLLEDAGLEDRVTFQAPDQPGTQVYLCTPHPRMMTGTLRIE